MGSEVGDDSGTTSEWPWLARMRKSDGDGDLVDDVVMLVGSSAAVAAVEVDDDNDGAAISEKRCLAFSCTDFCTSSRVILSGRMLGAASCGRAGR